MREIETGSQAQAGAAAIQVEALSKTYQVPEREGGFGAAVRSFFRRRYKNVEAVQRRQLPHRPRRGRRLPGAERRGQDDDPQDALRAAAPHRGHGARARLIALGAYHRLPHARSRW